MPTDSVPAASGTLVACWIALVLLLAVTFVVAVRVAWERTGATPPRARRAGTLAALLTAAWLAATAAAASRGWLHFAPPPTMLAAIVASLALAAGLALSPVGRRLAHGIPLAALVGFHGFRVGVELLLHRAYVEGLMPVQMSWSGRNFDVVTGASAIVLGAWLARGRRAPAMVLAWSVVGIGLLANVLVVAILSSPVPFRRFMNEPSNVWVTHAPWVWLPTVMVLAAVLGHGVVLRAVLAGRMSEVAAAETRPAPRIAG